MREVAGLCWGQQVTPGWLWLLPGGFEELNRAGRGGWRGISEI